MKITRSALKSLIKEEMNRIGEGEGQETMVLTRKEILKAWRSARIRTKVADSEAFYWSGIFHVGESGLVHDNDRVSGETLVTGDGDVDDMDKAIKKAIEDKGNVAEGAHKLTVHKRSLDDIKKNDPERYAEIQAIKKTWGMD
jgi:hypothetical protein